MKAPHQIVNAHCHKSFTSLLELQERCALFFRQKRIAAGLSETAVAEYLEISVDVLAAYENGSVGIPLDQMQMFSNFLNIPTREVMELCHELEEFKPLPFFQREIIGSKGQLGSIIRAARTAVALSMADLVNLFARESFDITEQELADLEEDKTAPSVQFWFQFCTLLHLNIEANRGYSRWEHLSNVRKAIENNEARIPISAGVINALREYQVALEDHNKIVNIFNEMAPKQLRKTPAAQES